MKKAVIGILAGMGPRSTAPFLTLVLDACERQYGARHDIDFPKLLICSQPAPFWPDRPVEPEAMVAAIDEGLKSLVAGGADFLGIACNTAHVYLDRLHPARPLLNMVDLAVEAVGATPRQIAIIAARPTMEAGLYQRALLNRGHRPITPDWQDAVDRLLGLTRETQDSAVLAAAWSNLGDIAQQEGTDSLLIACLDLTGILQHLTTDLPVVDAATELAEGLVRRWRAQ
ncbi:aspartate/glutamate racemase family protein [Lacibacterium aquatile]|uniref:Aspartate/glutamate racemase family protein n=1 Tax=Lacibacterium aquatile TaxID=1168082 RepID=A0ABW5DWB6_9PROT